MSFHHLHIFIVYHVWHGQEAHVHHSPWRIYKCTWSLQVHLLSWTCEPWYNRHGWPDVKNNNPCLWHAHKAHENTFCYGCDMHTKLMSTLFAMSVTCTQSSWVHFLLWTYVTCTQSPCIHLLPWDVHMKLVSTPFTIYVHVSMSFIMDYMHTSTSFTRAAMSTWSSWVHLYHGWNMHMKLPVHVTSIQLDISVQSHMSTKNLPRLGEVASLTKRRQSLHVFTLLLIPFSRPVRTKRGQSLQVVTLPVIFQKSVRKIILVPVWQKLCARRRGGAKPSKHDWNETCISLSSVLIHSSTHNMHCTDNKLRNSMLRFICYCCCVSVVTYTQMQHNTHTH